MIDIDKFLEKYKTIPGKVYYHLKKEILISELLSWLSDNNIEYGYQGDILCLTFPKKFLHECLSAMCYRIDIHTI